MNAAVNLDWTVESLIRDGWSAEKIRNEVERVIDECDDLFTAYDGPTDDATRCGRIMVGCGTDRWDPACDLGVGHRGPCKSYLEDWRCERCDVPAVPEPGNACWDAGHPHAVVKRLTPDDYVQFVGAGRERVGLVPAAAVTSAAPRLTGLPPADDLDALNAITEQALERAKPMEAALRRSAERGRDMGLDS